MIGSGITHRKERRVDADPQPSALATHGLLTASCSPHTPNEFKIFPFIPPFQKARFGIRHNGCPFLSPSKSLTYPHDPLPSRPTPTPYPTKRILPCCCISTLKVLKEVSTCAGVYKYLVASLRTVRWISLFIVYRETSKEMGKFYFALWGVSSCPHLRPFIHAVG